jgi:ferric-dicitrate binding protein FerR (iron transport regulator)
VTPTEPGWYPDPYGTGAKRWHDGTKWTSHLEVVPMPPPPAPAAAPVPPAPPRRPNHALHLVLTVLTAGLWLPVWVIVWKLDRRRRSG